jgi:DNA-binding transcriptional MerR regulator
MSYIKISELSRKTGASVRSLRYYERQGLLKPQRLENGYREYDESHVEWVKTIQLYLSFGTTTEELSRFLDCQTKSTRPSLDRQVVIDFYERKLLEIRKKIEQLRKAEKIVEQQLLKWRENTAPVIGDRVDDPDRGIHLLKEEVKEWNR